MGSRVDRITTSDRAALLIWSVDSQAGARGWTSEDDHGLASLLIESRRTAGHDGGRQPRGLQNRLRALKLAASDALQIAAMMIFRRTESAILCRSRGSAVMMLSPRRWAPSTTVTSMTFG